MDRVRLLPKAAGPRKDGANTVQARALFLRYGCEASNQPSATDAERGLAASPDAAQSLPNYAVDAEGIRHLGRTFERVARRAGPRNALVAAERACSYAGLLTAARAVRNRLRADVNFRSGDRVVIWLPNGPEYVAAFYGTLLAGGIVVPTPPDIEADRLLHILNACEARYVLTAEPVLRRRPIEFAGSERLPLSEPPDEGRGVRPIRFRDLPENAALRLPDGDSPAAIFFTSGSTGDPKGVTLSHTNLLSNARSIRQYLGIESDDRALGLLPFYHAFGNSVLQTHLLAGATVVVAGSLTFPGSIVEAARDHRLTSLSGVPDLFRTLLARSPFGQVELPSLRYLAVAEGKLDPDQAELLAARAAPAKLFVMYGQTEATARLSYLPPEYLADRYGSIGRGVPGVELQVVDDEGRILPPGEAGELRARGPNVMLGYWRDPQGTAAVLRDGWLYTGDLATTDADGFVYPQGRRSGLVKIAGYRVHPAELEDFVRRQLSVLQAVAVPYDCADLGTRFALFVQPWEDAITADGVRGLCAKGLPRHKVPEHVEVLDRFPLNNSYKVDRIALRRRAEAAAAEPT